MKKNISIIVFSLLLMLVVSSSAFCSLGATQAEHDLFNKYMNGQITYEEFLNAYQALPDDQVSPDVARMRQEERVNNSTSTSAITQTEVQKTEPKCNHTYTSEVLSEPTCIEKGIRKYTCQSCGNTYTEEIALVDEHDYKEEITKEPTCDETGEKTFTCKDCEKTYTELINSLGHSDEMKQTKNPTCTEQGEMTYTCTRCGLSHVETVEAKGHTEGEWNTVTPQGMFSEGLKEKSCADCGEVLTTEVIPSTYPIYYLYVGIGAALMVIAGIIVTIALIRKKK